MTRFLPLLLAITIFVSFFRLGSVTLFDVDEAVFAEATKEMVQSGNWITPTYNGENRYDKPILFYWLMAVSYKIFGINEFGARFPSALAGFILCISIFFFLREIIDEKKASYAVLSFALSIYFFTYSHSAVTDMVLTLFISLALFSFYLSLIRDRRYIYGLYIFSGLAFLTKGLIGILFPFGIALVYLFINKGLKGLSEILNWKAFVLFLIISSPWYIAQLIINGDEFIQQFFIKHHFKRYTGVISGHRGPLYYYIPVLIIGMFPWIAFLLQGIRKGLRLKAEGLKPQTFALIWFAFIFVFFSFSTTKLPNYIRPAIPAVSILISYGMAHYDEDYSSLPSIMLSVISLLLGAGFLVLKRYIIRYGIHHTGWIYFLSFLMFVFIIIGIYSLFKKRPSYAGLSCLMIVFFLVLSIKALPAANEYLQGTLFRYSLYAKDRLQDGILITYGINAPSIVFYSGHKIIRVDGKDAIARLIRSSDLQRFIVISKAKDIESLRTLGFNLIESDGRYAVLEGQ